MPVFHGDGRAYDYAPTWYIAGVDEWQKDARKRVATELDFAKERTLEWAREVYEANGHDPVRCDVVAHRESKTLAELAERIRIATSDRPKLGVWLSLAWTIYRVATLLWELWNREKQPTDKQVAAILGLLDRCTRENRD